MTDYIPNPDYRKEHNLIIDIYADKFLPKEYPDGDFSERNFSPLRKNRREPEENPPRPDIVGRDDEGNRIVNVEIETPGLINMTHARNHWDVYAELEGDFLLIVPFPDIDRAKRILINLGIYDITILKGYEWLGNKLGITDESEI